MEIPFGLCSLTVGVVWAFWGLPFCCGWRVGGFGGKTLLTNVSGVGRDGECQGQRLLISKRGASLLRLVRGGGAPCFVEEARGSRGAWHYTVPTNFRYQEIGTMVEQSIDNKQLITRDQVDAFKQSNPRLPTMQPRAPATFPQF